MPVIQPPIKEDPVESSWDLQLTENFNSLEQRFLSLLRAIETATTLDELKTAARDI